MVKLVVFDIDGTLVPSSTHKIADDTKEAIQILKDKGIIIVVATGRQYAVIQKEIKELCFDYYLCANGSLVCDSKGTILSVQKIEDHIIESLTNDFIDYNYPLALRYPSGSLEVNPNVSVIKYSHVFFSEEQLKEVEQYILFEKPKDEFPYACLGHIKEKYLKVLDQKYPDLSFVMTSGGALCDITLKEINKGTGLNALCKYLDINQDDTIAFGDDGNDIEMIHEAGVGIAMGNALVALKEKADYITDTCENLGVVKALKYFHLI